MRSSSPGWICDGRADNANAFRHGRGQLMKTPPTGKHGHVAESRWYCGVDGAAMDDETVLELVSDRDI